MKARDGIEAQRGLNDVFPGDEYPDPPTQFSLLDGETIGPQLDISNPSHGVQVQIREDGGVLWVNIDGLMRLRVCGIKPGTLEIEDKRKRRAKS